MNVRVWFVILWGLAMLGCGREGDVQDRVAARDAELAAALEHAAEDLALADAFAGVVSLSRDGRTLFQRAYGFADHASGRPNTVETPFALASVGKMFTAVAAARLVDEGRLSFDATIGALVPSYPQGQSAGEVTVHDLLTMSSGIPNLFESAAFWEQFGSIRTLPHFWPFFAAAPLRFPPGTQWEYSNSNFIVLGAIVEQIAAVPFTAYVEEEIFKRAGMTRTNYRSSAVPELAVAYTRTPQAGVSRPTDEMSGWYPVWDAGGEEDDFIAGAAMGGGVSTAGDLTRFAEALMRAELLSRDMTDRLMTGYIPAAHGGFHGYGIETRVINGVRIFGHAGGFIGISNQVDFYPDLGYVFVVLGNTDAAGAQSLATQVREWISGAPVLSGGR